MSRCILLILSFLFFENLNGQNYKIFELANNGQQGLLLRIESYDSGRLLLQNVYDDKGKKIYAIDQVYENGLLKKKVKTFFVEYPYDLVNEYSYDEDGQKTGELFGNNRSGKWGSYRFYYNQKGDFERIDIYQKNGDLTHHRHFKYKYDDTGRILEEIREYEDIEEEETNQEAKITYTYPSKNIIETNYFDAQNTLLFTEINTYDTAGKPLKTVNKIDGETNSQEFIYDNLGQIKTIKEFSNNRAYRTIHNEYSHDSIRTKQIIYYANGKKEGEVYVLQ